PDDGLWYAVFIIFFFQAEDGIRDYKVTGVQTCALPICGGADGIIRLWDLESRHCRLTVDSIHREFYSLAFSPDDRMLLVTARDKIGRASCRERGAGSGVAVSLKRKTTDTPDRVINLSSQ